MGKRNRKNSQLRIEQRKKEGRGLGRFDEYIPWLFIHDVASRGLVTRIKGIKTNRIHHLLSRLELYTFYTLDWATDVIDIREQYPLDLSETLAIAEELNIKHPKAPITNDYVVMTTDFLVTFRSSAGFYDIAINVKYSTDADKARTLEKFQIEKLYWERRGVIWNLVSEKNINPTLVRNIEWVHSYYKPEWLLEAIDKTQIENVTKYLLNSVLNSRSTLKAATSFSDKYFDILPGVSLLIVRYLIASRKWAIDMTLPIKANQTLCFFKEP